MRDKIYLLAVLLSLISCNKKTIPERGKYQIQDAERLIFSSKKEMLGWGKNKYGVSFFGKFDELNCNGKEYLIFYGYHGHGIIYTDIYILSRKSNLEKSWKVEKTTTTMNKYNFDSNYDQVKSASIITSEDGEVMLVFPI